MTQFESAQRSEIKYQLGESKANQNQFDGKDHYQDQQNRNLNRKENRKKQRLIESRTLFGCREKNREIERFSQQPNKKGKVIVKREREQIRT